MKAIYLTRHLPGRRREVIMIERPEATADKASELSAFHFDLTIAQRRDGRVQLGVERKGLLQVQRILVPQERTALAEDEIEAAIDAIVEDGWRWLQRAIRDAKGGPAR